MPPLSRLCRQLPSMGAEKPLLEERCPKGGVVASYRTMTSTPIFLHPSVDFVDSSPRWEPYMPLLEERCPKGGVVASYRTMTSTPISSPPSVDFVDSSPLWEPYMPLLEERWHAVSEWWFRVERRPRRPLFIATANYLSTQATNVRPYSHKKRSH